MRLKRALTAFLLAASLTGSMPVALHADAFGQLIDAAGGSVPDVPNVPDPTPVDDGSSSGYDNSNNYNSSDDSSYNNSSDSGSDSNSYNNSSYDSGSSSDNSSYSGSSGSSYSGSSDSGSTYTGPSIWDLFRPAPRDPVIEAKRREERQKAREERARKRKEAAKRRQSEREDREWEEKQRRKEEIKYSRGFVPPPRQSRATPPSLKQPAVDVPAGQEGKALSENQFRIATLLKKGTLTDQEKQVLAQLQQACRVLYNRAIGNENLSAEERSRIKLSIPVADFADPQIATSLVEQLTRLKADISAAVGAPEVDLIKKYNKEKLQTLAEQMGGEVAENAVEGGQEIFDNALGFAKVTAAIQKGDVPAAGKEVLDFMVGKIGSPQAGFAVEGGRMYSNVAFKAMDNFMKKAMGAVGQDFNSQEFWQKVRSEMNVGQKTVLEFIGGPDGK
ncbi:MAG TPA: hypothetical protein PLK28_05085 [Candidatus Rifleibacterium sp.]|nr:hypothetical protein [Candidatus Rifleibacterium sp.]